jgi:phosphoglycolate phosphatase
MENAGEPFRFTKEKMQGYMGLTPEETAPLAFPGRTLEEGLGLFKKALNSEIAFLAVHPGQTYPEEEKVLKLLASRYPLYIVSNSDKGYVENYLTACHMSQYFTGHVCCGDTGFPKWKNIIYLKEREKIDSVIYIGDTLKDKTESEKAGVRFIHAAYGFGQIANDENFISSLSELPALAEKIFKD